MLFFALDCAGSLGVCAVFWCFFWCSFLKTIAFFLLWIVLGVWKFVLFAVAFSGAFFWCSGLCFFRFKKIRQSEIHQVCALDCAGSLGVCAVFWCFFWCSFLKTVVLFLCSGLCWEFRSLCCFLVLFLVLLPESSCAFFCALDCAGSLGFCAVQLCCLLGTPWESTSKSTKKNTTGNINLETRPKFVKLKPFWPAGPPWSPTASSPGLAWATARCLQLPALQRNEKFHHRRGAMAPKGNPQRIGYRIAV